MKEDFWKEMYALLDKHQERQIHPEVTKHYFQAILVSWYYGSLMEKE